MKKLSAYAKENTTLCCIVLGVVLLLSMILCIGIGPVGIPFDTVWNVMFGKLLGTDISTVAENTQNIVWHLRTPRVLLGVMVGAGLSLAGVAMQALTKNPLADPYVLGISSGAYFGATIAIVFGGFAIFGLFKVQTGAFLGSMLAITVVYAFSRSGRSVTPITLILVGMAVAAMFGAFANFVVYSAPDDTKIRETSFWLLGGIAGVQWTELIPIAIVIGPGIIAMSCLSAPLNAMMMGDSAAVTLGVNLTLVRNVLIVVTAVLTGVTVAVAGCIGFVGLVIPHIVRSLVGADHGKVIPLSVLIGAIFLIWVDVGARMFDAPKEIPIGILTSMIGAPLFLWMLKARKYSFGEKA